MFMYIHKLITLIYSINFNEFPWQNEWRVRIYSIELWCSEKWDAADDDAVVDAAAAAFMQIPLFLF